MGTYDRNKVSVCIPSFNHAHFVGSAIESVLGQTHTNFELLVADDGSTDDSLDVIQRYVERDERVRLLTHPGHANKGASATLNLCLDTASGDFWTGLGSDDLFLPRTVEIQLQYLAARPGTDLVYGPVAYIDANGRSLGATEFGAWGSEDISQYPEPVHRMILRNVIPGMAFMTRRSLIERIALRFNEAVVHGDWEFWVRFVSNGKVGHIAEPLAKYRYHGGNTSVKISKEVDLSRSLEALDAIAAVAETDRGSLGQPAAKSLIQLQLSFLRFCAEQIEFASAHLSKAFQINPDLGEEPEFFRWWMRRREPVEREPEYPWPSKEMLSRLRRARREQIKPILREYTYPTTKNFVLWLLEQLSHFTGEAFFGAIRDEAILLILERTAQLAQRGGDTVLASDFACRRFISSPDVRSARTAVSFIAERWLGKEAAYRYRAWKRNRRDMRLNRAAKEA